ncbi:hypothetical protein SShM2_182 [Synechococcus phage S-ShM2]|uniref:Uncharacterized protein n=3 Tax=Ahtivirus sagseatwo TaxID=2734079 RepID=A0A1D7SIY4_9CAUD|nr:hypothetical protein SShM2_182 [Synechococcus phage S-ShM2]AGH57382.1 hypothetical protein CPLG_00128 [Cyanophage S-SSM2]AOO13286.1 hypothetical protein LIS021110_172 [Cyanophage S-RIM14]ADO97793.1 hypothetical protein SShM2_182 [Synechococcus phage S-ShM2]AOO13502.1 hypothetical protein LIS110610_172 [Cyanophage S-RIM14]AOO13718.1 hypothetical protein Np111211_172 [Cyanophage S-RIM14]
MNYEALPGMEDALKLVQEKKMSKEAHKKAAKAGKRWQDSDGDGKWYEKGDDVKESAVDSVDEEKKELPKNKMFRKAGNLGRDVVSPSVTDDQRQKAYGRSKKIIKTLNKANEEVEEVQEDDKSYDRNRKRAAQRAADRNAARAAGKTGVVPGVGYVTARKEKESYTDSKGVERHKSGAKNEEVETVDEAEQRVKAKADKKMKVYGGPAYIKKPDVKKEEVEIEEGMKAARDNVGASTCWKGYTAKGTKTKNGKEVPNCVPANEELEMMEASLMESGLFSESEVRYIIGEKFEELSEG